VTSWIVYNESNLNPEPAIISAWDDFDDIDMYPLYPEGVVPPDDSITLGFEFTTLGNGANYAQFNGISYTSPIIPTLVTVLTAPSELVTNSTIYGTSTSPFILNHNEMIQIVLNNFDTGKHPCESPFRYTPIHVLIVTIVHLHGHVFQVLYRSDNNEGPYNESMNLTFTDNPLRRDTILVNPGGFIILRFRADNPGVWFV
jgi:iron transport multicopper oxidase